MVKGGWSESSILEKGTEISIEGKRRRETRYFNIVKKVVRSYKDIRCLVSWVAGDVWPPLPPTSSSHSFPVQAPPGSMLIQMSEKEIYQALWKTVCTACWAGLGKPLVGKITSHHQEKRPKITPIMNRDQRLQPSRVEPKDYRLQLSRIETKLYSHVEKNQR